MVEKLSDEETALLQAVACWLSEEMHSHLGSLSPAPDLLHDLAQSNYEISCSALERVGLLASEGHYWRVLEPNKNQPTLGNSYKRCDLDHLLDGLACHSHYVNNLYQHQEAVTPTRHALREVCVSLAACGYMEATSKRTFEWTDDFGPWLVRHGAWDLDEFEPASQEEVNEALATIPAQSREWLSGSLCRHKPDFVRCFFAQWIDGKWEEREWRHAPSDDWDLSLAAGLYAQLHSQ
ncbi:hypothetical protein [uncultured Pelagimonas sp.]|uniref:hypothetical protein n=1 Tax=uncultured Pelagimonas sp. TaxID=1618102 RepID=UPI0026375169|nr:hypothetical protein [uncultured Pelagimonas sp.]